jgi:uncharacterized protein (TIGR02996 family)
MGMPYDPSIDPEDLFWERIQDHPDDPIPRLLYADWCDENDRPVMSIVQRWLAATGRMPNRWHSGLWTWITETTPPSRHLVLFFMVETTPLPPIEKARTLPDPLFRCISSKAAGLVAATPGHRMFQSRRTAEEALVGAWSEATKPRFWRGNWKPDFEHARGRAVRRPRIWELTQQEFDDRFSVKGVPLIILCLILFVIVVGLVRHSPQKSRPSVPPATGKENGRNHFDSRRSEESTKRQGEQRHNSQTQIETAKPPWRDPAGFEPTEVPPK